MGPKHCFFPRGNFPKSKDNILCFSFNKIHKSHLSNNIILKILLSQNPQVEKYTKTSEN